MIYVIIQFSAIFALIINTNVENFEIISWFLMFLSLLIGVTALVNMKISNLNIMPTLKDNHTLITNGIYNHIRHPMYTSVILLSLALLLTNLSLINILTMLILIIDLYLKANFEEKLLISRFSNYKKYTNKTGKFLPFV